MQWSIKHMEGVEGDAQGMKVFSEAKPSTKHCYNVSMLFPLSFCHSGQACAHSGRIFNVFSSDVYKRQKQSMNPGLLTSWKYFHTNSEMLLCLRSQAPSRSLQMLGQKMGDRKVREETNVLVPALSPANYNILDASSLAVKSEGCSRLERTLTHTCI